LFSVPLAVGYWTGIAGERLRHNGYARILSFHGTPRRYASELERRLRYLKRAFRVVPLDALAAAVAARDAGLDRQVAITFDDGIRSNVLVAYPLLEKLRIPATFFVCPGLIERKAWLWNMEARQRLLSLDARLVGELARECGAPADLEAFVRWMKTLGLAERARVEARIRDASRNFRPSEAEREQCDVAGWDDLATLDPRIVTIGSHSLTHPILLRSTAQEIETEIAGSRAALEARLQRPVELFAYPNGDQNDEVRNCVRKHYRAAVTTVQTWVPPGCDPFLLPRVDAPRGAIRLCWDMHLPAYLPCAS
jgi:peptidoglycan/xylan/chitin deacetylase (PgdA/CDA1 family)